MSQGGSATGTKAFTWMMGTEQESLWWCSWRRRVELVCFVHQENPSGIHVMGRVQEQEAEASPWVQQSGEGNLHFAEFN